MPTESPNIPEPTPEDDVIPHQERVEYIIANELEDDTLFARRTTTVITTPTAPGATYDQTEMASLKTAIDAMRAVLTASHVSG